MHATSNSGDLPSPILDSYEAYGCKVNAIGVDELFQRYEQAGFLYPAKMQRLAPFMPLVKENWRKAFRAGELIHWVATYADPSAGAWGAISSWRSTDTGWVTQHLVSNGSPKASRAVMLGGQAVRLRDGFDTSHQNWFRRDNRFANKIFGSITQTLGEENGWVCDYSYFAIPLDKPLQGPVERIITHAATLADKREICEFVRIARSPVYVQGEELSGDDLELQAVDTLYRRVGLRRFRRVFLARITGTLELIGVALAYRGPLGFNFSFLENRCDCILKPGLSESDAAAIYNSLVTAAANAYRDFEPRIIPVVVISSHEAVLRSLGAEFIRAYAQSVWLQPGYERWYRHTERFYDRVVSAEMRRGLAPRDISKQRTPSCENMGNLRGGGKSRSDI